MDYRVINGADVVCECSTLTEAALLKCERVGRSVQERDSSEYGWRDVTEERVRLARRLTERPFSESTRLEFANPPYRGDTDLHEEGVYSDDARRYGSDD